MADAFDEDRRSPPSYGKAPSWLGVSYALWFWTLVRYSASELSAFIFITPLVGVLAGWLVFGETMTRGFALAIALVLAGLALVNWPRAHDVKARGRAVFDAEASRQLRARLRSLVLRVERLAEPAGEILDELPGGAAGARAARRRPFERLRPRVVSRGASRPKCSA